MDGADSPKAKDSKPSKEAKENTNPSESEDDESSISKTGGIVSTSDGKFSAYKFQSSYYIPHI